MAVGRPNPSPGIPNTKVQIGAPSRGGKKVPTLFTPLQIRGLLLQNRFAVSPMGTYSAQNGFLTEFHLVHYGAYALRGAALTIIECTSVTENSRTSPQDTGLWMDSQVPPLKRVADFVHSQGQKIGIQLNHAGSKASMLAPLMSPGGESRVATLKDGGCPDDVWAPSSIPYDETHVIPKALETADIKGVIRAFADAARRAVEAGVDLIEIHGAHGYLIHQFLSPLTNHRSDEYGGSFENRTRFLFEVLKAVRDEIPAFVPISLRISATDWMEWTGQPSWDLEQSVKLAKLLPAAGVDILDVSSGGTHKDQKIEIHPRYQIDLAAAIHLSLKQSGIPLLVAAVGFITTTEIADKLTNDHENGIKNVEGATGPQADLILIGRQFLRQPDFVLQSAYKLGVEVQWPFQYERAQTKVV